MATLPATIEHGLANTFVALDATERAALAQPLGAVVAATLQAAARSEHTRRAYIASIGYFLGYLDARLGDRLPGDWRALAAATREGMRTVWAYGGLAAALRLVDAGLLDGFRAWREDQGDSANTASKHIAAVRTFLSVAYRDHVLTTEQAQRMGLRPYRQRQRRDRKPVGRRLTKPEARALRKAVDTTTPKGKRDAAILDMALYGALRAQELATLRLADFVQDGGRWWVTVLGKGQKTRRLKLADVAYRSLSAWLGVAALALGDAGRAFRSVNKAGHIGGRAVNTSTVGRLVAEYGHAAGLAPAQGENRLSPHDLRRTAARNAHDNGAPLLLVQRWLGHADPSTTAHYIGLQDDDGQSAVDFVRY